MDKYLREQQEEAVLGANAELLTADRCKVVMACGTGKTRVGAALAILRDARTVIVYLPSLCLMRQTLMEWKKAPFVNGADILCVCSDNSVASKDDTVVTTDELTTEFHNPVTSKADDVRAFFGSETNAVRVVFSTYQSCDVVSNGCPEGFTFELGIFDEAHRTAGKHSGFSAPLNDSHTQIAKRVFMTATPKHFNLRNKNKINSEATIAYSMDNDRLYGRMAYNLPIRQAIDRGLIADYQVLVAVVDDKTIAERLRSGQHDGDSIEQIAHAIAIKDAMSKYGVTKIVTFHDSVNDAQQFAANATVQQELGVPTFHVNGSIQTRDRAGIMQHFAATPQALVTNARCLTEGVDVPAIDMVAFLHPKKSEIDIIQAIGRALRLDDGKRGTAYILLPVYVHQIEDGGIEAALEEMGFDCIVQVIQALKERDEVVQTVFRNISMGKGTGNTDDLPFITISGPDTHLDLLRSAITTQCLNYLTEDWWSMYGQLVKFFEGYGNLNVPQNSKLFFWKKRQRKVFKNNGLPQEKLEALNTINFVFDAWREKYNVCVRHVAETGCADVPITHPIIGQWCAHQRVAHKANKLSLHKIALLKKIGFRFDLRNEIWMEKYNEAEKHFTETGSGFIPTTHPVIGEWGARLRKDLRVGRLTPLQIELLKKINFMLDKYEVIWLTMFDGLKLYKAKHGHVNVPRRDGKLGGWCGTQRKDYHAGRMSESRVALLISIGFSWELVGGKERKPNLSFPKNCARHGSNNAKR